MAARRLVGVATVIVGVAGAGAGILFRRTFFGCGRAGLRLRPRPAGTAWRMSGLAAIGIGGRGRTAGRRTVGAGGPFVGYLFSRRAVGRADVLARTVLALRRLALRMLALGVLGLGVLPLRVLALGVLVLRGVGGRIGAVVGVALVLLLLLQLLLSDAEIVLRMLGHILRRDTVGAHVVARKLSVFFVYLHRAAADANTRAVAVKDVLARITRLTPTTAPRPFQVRTLFHFPTNQSEKLLRMAVPLSLGHPLPAHLSTPTATRIRQIPTAIS